MISRVTVPVLAISALLATALPALAQQRTTVSTAAFIGGDVGPNAHSLYGGAITALNGDLARDGVLLRGLVAYAPYHYTAVAGNISGALTLADAMVGYQAYMQSLRVAGYIGGEYQEHNLSPQDPRNPVTGARGGLKLAGDITTLAGSSVYFNLMGNVSTAFDSYWSRARIGLTQKGITFGPEAIFNGNVNFNSQRYGGFVSMQVAGTPFELTLSGGQHFNEKSGIFASQDGAYGALNLNIVY